MLVGALGHCAHWRCTGGRGGEVDGANTVFERADVNDREMGSRRRARVVEVGVGVGVDDGVGVGVVVAKDLEREAAVDEVVVAGFL